MGTQVFVWIQSEKLFLVEAVVAFDDVEAHDQVEF